jgi:hypothetical protein
MIVLKEDWNLGNLCLNFNNQRTQILLHVTDFFEFEGVYWLFLVFRPAEYKAYDFFLHIIFLLD